MSKREYSDQTSKEAWDYLTRQIVIHLFLQHGHFKDCKTCCMLDEKLQRLEECDEI